MSNHKQENSMNDALASLQAENERLLDGFAPHWCSDGHEPVRHWDDTDERCPLCRLIDERDRLRDELAAYRYTLIELRLRLHAKGRRPEECYEMSLIDAALKEKRDE